MYTAENPLTLPVLSTLEAGEVFASGVIENSPEGLNMVSSNIGRKLIWAAVKGYAPYHDWSIYCHWEENGMAYVLSHGDKVTSDVNIQRVVPCTVEVLQHYRR